MRPLGGPDTESTMTGQVSGFVLTGGRSSRMGSDKALLELGGIANGARIAAVLEKTCGTATIVGDVERHAALGRPVIADLHSGIGPLGGIEAALAAAGTPWVLVAACDMPGLTAEFLDELVHEAELLEREGANPDAILPIPPGSPSNPLCALYHRRILPRIREAIASGDYKITRALEGTRLHLVAVDDGTPLRNANTPAEWEALQQALREAMLEGSKQGQ